MISKIAKKLGVLAFFGAMSVNAQAATIYLQPSTNVNIAPNGVATYQLWADASDVGGFLAGGLDLFYNSSILTYNNDFAFDASFPTDPSFTRTGDNCVASPSTPGCTSTAPTGEINGIAFGNFSGLAASGPTLVGTLSFTGSSQGVSQLTMADNNTPAGAWYATNGSGPLSVAYGTGQVTVGAVPLPAAAWLMTTGLGVLLLGFTRNRKGV
jgi:hypothetical protein